MLIYVCCLSVVLCHRRWLVDLMLFLPVKIGRYIIYGLRLGEGRLLFCIVQLVFDFFNTRHGSLYLSRIEFLQLIFGNTERLVSSL